MSPLLRAHCEWPGGHGAADQRDECASLHVLPPPEGNTLPHRDAALCSTAKAIAEWSKWVRLGLPTISTARPLCLSERTWPDHLVMSQKCQKATYAVQQAPQ